MYIFLCSDTCRVILKNFNYKGISRRSSYLKIPEAVIFFAAAELEYFYDSASFE